MASFKDNAGREWTIAIDAPTILTIREECDPLFMLESAKSASTYERLESDPATLCRVIYCLCDEQRKERGISEASFYGEVIGDAIDAATDALLKAIISFSPRRQRKLLEAAAGMRERIQRKGIDTILAKIAEPEVEEAIMASVSQEIEKAMAKILSTPQSSASRSPAPSESEPTV
jgi:hypothetical protein